MMAVVVLCAILGAVALPPLAGARQTESAYGRYLSSIDVSDVTVNVPNPNVAIAQRVARLPGVASSAIWVGLNVNPVVHGRVDYSFLTNGRPGVWTASTSARTGPARSRAACPPSVQPTRSP